MEDSMPTGSDNDSIPTHNGDSSSDDGDMFFFDDELIENDLFEENESEDDKAKWSNFLFFNLHT